MWRDQLRPASFRGVPFQTTETQLTVGRRLARHEYPQRDLPYLEDMGRKAREYKIDAYVVGGDYMPQRDALLEAVEKAGAGQLVHPKHGTLLVVVQDCQLSESTQTGGYAKFSFTFVEAGKREAPAVTVDTRGQFARAKSTVKSRLESVYADLVKYTAAPMSVIQDGLASLNELRAIPGAIAAIAQGSYGSALAILLPDNAMSALQDPMALVRGVVSLGETIGGLSSMLAFDRPTVTANSATAVRRNQYRSQMTLMVRQAAVLQHVDNLLVKDYPSVNDARIARAEIIAVIDTILLHPDLDHRAAQAVTDFRTASLAQLQSLAPSLPQLVSIPNNRERPALVVAHEHYGDDWWKTGKDASLISRNRVRHPLMVPVQSLQLEALSGR